MNVCQTGAEQRPALRAIDICKVEDPPAGPFFSGRQSVSWDRCDLFFFVAERFCLLYEDFLAVAGEGIFHERFIRLGSDHGKDRDDHKADEHAERACVDGGLQHFRKSRTDQHIGEHEAD